MKDKKRTTSLSTKIGGIAFLFVFVLNIMLFVRRDVITSNLSLDALKAYAQSGGEGGESDENGCLYTHIIYEEQFGYVPLQCCLTEYQYYIDHFECYSGSCGEWTGYCPGRHTA